MKKYKAMLDTHEFVNKWVDGEELYYGPCDLRCECCNDRMDPTEEPEDVVHVRDRDNIYFNELCWYHIYHYDNYSTIQELLRNPLKVDYSAMEQFIHLAD